MPISPIYRAAPIFLELGEGFADVVAAAPFPNVRLRFRNQGWAARVGLDTLTPDEWTAHFARFEPLPANLPQPLALRYHGHQFRHYNPEIGDGRGFLFAQLREPRRELLDEPRRESRHEELGELRHAVDGRILDLGTKGSGTTPYSRRGDGRLTLKGAVREVLATEMLESLGVVTSKTLSVFETGESLDRHDEPSPTRAAVLVRLNHSHVRFGTFQRLAFFNETEKIEKLIQYCLCHYFPGSAGGTVSFLREIVARSAGLAADWMVAGFVHGVLNTDNMNITGESFDYGPYRFLPTFDPDFTAAYFDEGGLYAYGRQPEAVLWNLEQLALALSKVGDREQLLGELHEFVPLFNAAITERFITRMGLVSRGKSEDEALFTASFDLLVRSQVTYEQFYHDWHGGLASHERALRGPGAYRVDLAAEAFDRFLACLRTYEGEPAALARLRDDYFKREKPCMLLIDEIEWIWDAIAKDDDWSRFEAKVADIRRMGDVYGRRART